MLCKILATFMLITAQAKSNKTYLSSSLDGEQLYHSTINSVPIAGNTRFSPNIIKSLIENTSVKPLIKRVKTIASKSLMSLSIDTCISIVNLQELFSIMVTTKSREKQ